MDSLTDSVFRKLTSALEDKLKLDESSKTEFTSTEVFGTCLRLLLAELDEINLITRLDDPPEESLTNLRYINRYEDRFFNGDGKCVIFPHATSQSVTYDREFLTDLIKTLVEIDAKFGSIPRVSFLPIYALLAIDAPLALTPDLVVQLSGNLISVKDSNCCDDEYYYASMYRDVVRQLWLTVGPNAKDVYHQIPHLISYNLAERVRTRNERHALLPVPKTVLKIDELEPDVLDRMRAVEVDETDGMLWYHIELSAARRYKLRNASQC